MTIVGKGEIIVDTEAMTIRIIVDKDLFNKILEVLEWSTDLPKWKGWCKPRPDLNEIVCRYIVIGDVEIEVTARSEENC